MDTYWLEQTGADVPVEDGWLSPGEAAHLSGMRFSKRRAEWRLGRWTAKQAVSAYLKLSDCPEALSAIEIRPAANGAPLAFLGYRPAPVTISLSHRSDRAACAIAPAGIALGCDLELIETRSKAFLADYFTVDEQHSVTQAPEADRARLLTLLWSAKESALKALGEGLRLDTRCVIVSPARDAGAPSDWRSLRVRYTGGRTFHGWWRNSGDLVRVLVADPPPGPPVSVPGSSTGGGMVLRSRPWRLIEREAASTPRGSRPEDNGTNEKRSTGNSLLPELRSTTVPVSPEFPS